MSSKKEKVVFRLGEYFCGPGGLALGAKKARVVFKGKIYGYEHAWANDYDEDTCKTYGRNICPNSPESIICKDVRKLDIHAFSPIEVFAYGFPCNDFSIVGEQKGLHGTFGPLYTYGLKLIDLLHPKFFVAENVSGLSSSNEGRAFKKILEDLGNAGKGYDLTAHLYRCEDYAVPQTRHRVIIVGSRRDLKLKYAVPTPTTSMKPISAKEAIENPPIPADVANQELTAQSSVVVERLKCTKPGENVWNAKLPERLQLNVKGAKLSQIYRRLHPDKPSYTITGSGGGGTHGYHWSEPRALTNRERARLQTFPDDFVFEGSKESVRKQIGMAVPPKMAEVIFSAILKTYLGLSYPSVPANISTEDRRLDFLAEPVLVEA